MTSISSMETVTPDTHPNSSSSPLDDEDLGRRRIWEDGDELSLKSASKGKQKGDGYPDGEASDEPGSEIPDFGVYPPTNDEEAETRRIEENLRTWQMSEMQKRKAARESAAVKSASSRGSSIWPKSNLRQRELGKHAALGSDDSVENLPLDNLVTTPGPSPTPSPAPSPRQPDTEEDPQNPFANPPVSPFADSQQVTAVMSPSEPPLTDPDYAVASPTPERPTLLAKSASFSRHPPPKPLNLPPPKTPPPPIDAPPRAISPPSTDVPPNQHGVPEKETRWWHEWLCGCGEDRDADNQAGRTNPFE